MSSSFVFSPRHNPKGSQRILERNSVKNEDEEIKDSVKSKILERLRDAIQIEVQKYKAQ